MVDILVRNVDEKVAKGLRTLAKADGRSLAGFLRLHYEQLIAYASPRRSMSEKKKFVPGGRPTLLGYSSVQQKREDLFVKLTAMANRLPPSQEDAVTLINRSREEAQRQI